MRRAASPRPGGSPDLPIVSSPARTPSTTSRAPVGRTIRFQPSSTSSTHSVSSRSGHAGHSEPEGFLLHAAGVGQDQPGVPLQPQHIQVADRVDHTHVFRHPAGGPRSRVFRVRGCSGRTMAPRGDRESPRRCRQAGRVVGVLGPVDGRQVALRRELEAIEDAARARPGRR